MTTTARPERGHRCPANCGTTNVPYRLYACPTDWARLPGPLKSAIVKAAARRRTDPAAHRDAMNAATDWYRQHPAKAVTP